jgi:hypothetical protein
VRQIYESRSSTGHGASRGCSVCMAVGGLCPAMFVRASVCLQQVSQVRRMITMKDKQYSHRRSLTQFKCSNYASTKLEKCAKCAVRMSTVEVMGGKVILRIIMSSSETLHNQTYNNSQTYN